MGVIVLIGIALYAGFNLWVYRGFKGLSLPKQGETFTRVSPTPTPTATPTPTPRPSGPGEYACDPYGVCNKYSDEARNQYCRVTFADDRCLDQCGDTSKQCTL